MPPATLVQTTRRRNRGSSFGGLAAVVASVALVSLGCSEDATSMAGLGGSVDAAPAAAPGGSEDAAPVGPVAVPLRVHTSRSALPSEALTRALQGINDIWAPADVCFDVEVVTDDATDETALDLFLTATTIPGNETANGVYRGPDDIWTVDAPVLDPAPHPYGITTSRTAAHELGHALGLAHQDCGKECPCGASQGLDCDDLLMRSGTLGHGLTDGELQTARGAAEDLGARGSCSVATR